VAHCGSFRVAQVTECFTPVVNGVVTVIRTQADALRLRGHAVKIVAPNHPEADPEEDKRTEVTRLVSFWPTSSPYPFMKIWRYSQERHKIARYRPQVVHSHHPYFAGVFAWLWAQQEKAVLISTAHTNYLEYARIHVVPRWAPPWLAKGIVAINRWWLRTYYNRCDAVIAVAGEVRNWLAGYGVRTPIHVIPTAVDLPEESDVRPAAIARIRENLQERWGIPITAPLLLYVGRIAPEKNLPLLLRSFARIEVPHPDCRLLLIGPGPEEEALRVSLAALPYGHKVTVAGSLPHAEVLALYPAADLFVLPSTTEAQGLVGAEALAAGLPCVTTTVGGAHEAVLHGLNGYKTPPEVDAFSQAILHFLALSPEKQAEMRRQARQHARAYSVDLMIDQVEAVYRECLNRRNSTETNPRHRG
jgi:1,2-diacylglycerol 3-alpha-glucosyltransferase